MSGAGLAASLRPLAPAAALLLVLLFAAGTLLHHFFGFGDEAAQRAAIQRYERIAAELPSLEAASAQRSTTPAAPGNANVAAAMWQTRLGQLATTRGLQLVSAEPLLADGRQTIALELIGGGAGLLAFVYEIERGTPAMTVARLEVAPAGGGDAAQSEPPLRIRLVARAAGGMP